MKATEVTAGPAESNGSLLPGLWRDSLHVTCGLTACTPGSAPGPTLGNEYGKTLPCYLLLTRTSHVHARYQRLRPVPTPHSSQGPSSRPILACTARLRAVLMCKARTSAYRSASTRLRPLFAGRIQFYGPYLCPRPVMMARLSCVRYAYAPSAGAYGRLTEHCMDVH